MSNKAESLAHALARLEKVRKQRDALLKCCQNFVHKVNIGIARSRGSYEEMTAAIALCDAGGATDPNRSVGGEILHVTRTQAANQIQWLENMHTLHQSVCMQYVVDGYEVWVEKDGNQISKDYHGETLTQAITAAMKDHKP